MHSHVVTAPRILGARCKAAASAPRRSSPLWRQHTAARAVHSQATALRSTESKLIRIRGLTATHTELQPVEGQNFAVAVWQLISELTPHERLLLLDKLTGRDIAQCWAFASLLYDAPGKTREHAQGGWNLADDFPRLPEEALTYHGKAALRVGNRRVMPEFWGSRLIDRFDKVFALHPSNDSIIGRVDVGKGLLGRRLYPLYFEVDQTLEVPHTKARCELALRYLTRQECTFDHKRLPADKQWPPPGTPSFPFGGGLVDYLRPIGPGVYVGVGWKPGGRRRVARQFLHFLLVRQPPPVDQDPDEY